MRIALVVVGAVAMVLVLGVVVYVLILLPLGALFG